MLTQRHGPPGMPPRMQPSGIVRSLTGLMEVGVLRGEIRLVDFEPSVGSEANKRRPALIVSNDHANAAAARLGRGVVTVVPLTSLTSRVLPFQVFLPSEATGLPKDSKAQAEQVRSIAVERVGEVVGWLPGGLMKMVNEALILHLSL
ncbi:type II toxin-antitoxin system PemK/MazF family toxin [Actinomyces oris]|uniref:type II toxin-antitoxin system PemK/MazF family toxin n=1 Tax=Actinomyces oris TaxID=544580 RepID=UPI0028524C00|nr:type II toxin-antitoxin system PemK/MazF family toxin [Actinomyces oris]